MRKFYYEYDPDESVWAVYERYGDQPFDLYAFDCVSEDDAIEAVDLLHELQQH